MKNKLYILWTNADPITSEKMVCMYAKNALLNNWWDDVTIIVWGATVQYLASDASIQKEIKDIINCGVHVSACRSCVEQLKLLENIDALGIHHQYWGEALSSLIKGPHKLITI